MKYVSNNCEKINGDQTGVFFWHHVLHYWALFLLIRLCSEWCIVHSEYVCLFGELAKLIKASDQSVWSA